MTPPEQLTDAEIAREMAEVDGWNLIYINGYWLVSGPGWESGGFTSEERAWCEVLTLSRYPRSLDAAVGWLGRREFRWTRVLDADVVQVTNGIGWYSCAESPTCPTERAICNAGVAAWRAQQAKELAS
jgi:hypothetical protein